jgi:glycine/D-amino acid oxidase-like deaminating enzyme
MRDADVVVVGAGVIGVAAARELAPDHGVIVLDKGQVAGDTTAKASGLITIVPDLDERPAVARYAVDFFEEYDGTGEFSFTPRESVQLVTDDEEAWARDQATRVADNGFDVEYLEPDAVEDRFPGEFVLDDFVGAVRWGDTGWVDPYTYTMTLRADAEADGVEFRTDTAVESVDAEGGDVTGVTTAAGRIEAPEVVCATGWRTSRPTGAFCRGQASRKLRRSARLEGP